MSTDQRAPTRSSVAIALAINDDVWDVVASELEHNHPALRAAALTSSVLRAPMQRTLFRTVYIDADRLSPFSVSLLANPALAIHIRWLSVQSASVLLHLLVNLDGGGAPNALASVRGLHIGSGSWSVNEERLPMLAAQFTALGVLELAHTAFLDARAVQRVLACFPSLHTLRWHRSRIQISHIEPGTLALPRLRNFHWDEETYHWADNTYDERAEAWAYAGAWEHLERFAVCARATSLFWPALTRASTTLRHLCLINIMSANMLDAVFPNQGRRSNILFAHLETLVLDMSYGIEQNIINALARLLDSLSSPRLHSLVLVSDQFMAGLFVSVNWAPLIDSVLDLHRELSPGLRKSVCVLFLESETHEDFFLSTKDALSCLRDIADVDVRVVSQFNLAANVVGPVPGFPLLASRTPAR